MAVLRNRRGLWGSELTSRCGPSKAGELGACLLRHQAFRKPPPSWRLLKGLVPKQTGTQLPHDRKRKRGNWAFRKPPPHWRLLKGLVHQRTGTQLHCDRKRKHCEAREEADTRNDLPALSRIPHTASKFSVNIFHFKCSHLDMEVNSFFARVNPTLALKKKKKKILCTGSPVCPTRSDPAVDTSSEITTKDLKEKKEVRKKRKKEGRKGRRKRKVMEMKRLTMFTPRSRRPMRMTNNNNNKQQKRKKSKRGHLGVETPARLPTHRLGRCHHPTTTTTCWHRLPTGTRDPGFPYSPGFVWKVVWEDVQKDVWSN
ncbi:hypothetical protein QTO34_018281 [Cnephaeus nilssonii]|uniref:Uncharacterized protein n=1 Tax=Cnephaeus nilssonii TaxID=3371016 RepID=A0AA40HZ99_CNENI|nr:hypothetical protein QTO34_018281 [Eptesicus nilssonii]